MRIATYNIWNSSRGMPHRKKQIINEIDNTKADIIGLQEVTKEIYEYLEEELTMFRYSYFHEFATEYKGLALFSKNKLKNNRYIENAILSTFKFNDETITVINIHLPWDSVLQREKLIIEIIKVSTKVESDYTFLLGDFNDFNGLDNSSIHHYITGQRTLNSTEAEPYFYDLAEIYAEFTGKSPAKTLDLRNNPRWQGKQYAATSGRVDRIYYKEPFPKPFPLLKSVSIFGLEVNSESHYCASDHYGVLVELTFENDI